MTRLIASVCRRQAILAGCMLCIGLLMLLGGCGHQREPGQLAGSRG